MTTVYTLKIDGRDVAATEGQTIMDVAEESGIDIPGLCHLQGIHDRGACRPCCRQGRSRYCRPSPARRRGSVRSEHHPAPREEAEEGELTSPTRS